MATVVGIDTSLSLTADVQPGLSFLGDAIAWLGGMPAVAIRPMGTGAPQGKKGATPVTAVEINGLRVQGLAVGVYFNDSPLNSGAPATAAQGAADARTAQAQAAAIGVDAGTYLWFDLESNIAANPANTVAAVAAYLTALAAANRPSVYGGSGGVYGIMAPGSLLGDALVQALASDSSGDVARLVLWPAQWTVGAGGFALSSAPAWAPNVPTPLLGMVRMIQVSGNDFNDICDLNLVDDTLLLPGGGLMLPASQPAPIATAPPAPAAPNLPAAQGALAQAATAIAAAQAALGS